MQNPGRSEVEDARRMWRDVEMHAKWGAAFVVGAATASTVIVPILIAVAWLGHSRRLRYEDLVEDPPRTDYMTISTPRPARLNLEGMGDSELERAFRGFADPMRLATAEISAFVRALERVQGAEQADDATWAARQRAEADRFRYWAVEHLRAEADAAPRLTDGLYGAGLSGREPDPSKERQTLAGTISDEALARVYRWGIPIGFLRGRLDRPDAPLDSLAAPEAINRAAGSDLEVARLLRTL